MFRRFGPPAPTLKYQIKEHALLLIFNILPPLLAFFHPARLIIFRKISTLLFYSIPARLFHPALLDHFFFIQKIYLHPVLLALVYSILTYTWSCLHTYSIFKKSTLLLFNFKKISTLLVYSISARLLIFRKISTLLVYSILLDY